MSSSSGSVKNPKTDKGLRRVRLQNLRDFTVQIRITGTETIVGTGIAISADGKVVTCAHVAEAALEKYPRQASDTDEVGVYFPEMRGRKGESRRARVAACFPDHEDDVVLLQLTDGLAPLAPEQIPKLGKAEGSEKHEFQSYGYAPLGKQIAKYVDGKIMGPVEMKSSLGTRLQAEPVELRTRDIRPGISGAAVLDTDKNLVVGLISERYFPDSPVQDDIGYAVDNHVLTFNPFKFTLRDEPLARRAAPQPKTDVEKARAAVAAELGVAWNNAPVPLEEWVGREDLLAGISSDWMNLAMPVTGLIGFGGEGKSSVARQWVDNLLADKSQPQPDGVFWWGFYTKPSVDEFFEAALKYLSGGKIDPRDYPSSSAKAHFIAAMLSTGRYLFILDGLEIMQHQEGDRYGLLKSGDLRDFVEYFARPDHESFCLITSRASILNLMDYMTYTHRDIVRLSPTDGRALLRKVGAKGDDKALDKVVTDWGGHALTLGLIGAYLAEAHKGDVAHIGEIPPPVADEPRYERVHRVLRRYDKHLNDAERAFLTLFSAFRTPVHESAFERVFRTKTKATSLNAPVAKLSKAKFKAMVQRLVAYCLLRYDPDAHTYTAHPLIRAHYFGRLTEGKRIQAKDAHQQIKNYYLELAGDTPYNPTLDDLAPLIEVVHHACQAGAYDEAYRVHDDRIDQGDRKVIGHQLGAYETLFSLAREFYRDGDASQEPQVSEPGDKGWILNTVGFCLMNLGRLAEAVPFYERAVACYLREEKRGFTSMIYGNVADLRAYLGDLTDSSDAALEALALSRRAQDKGTERGSLSKQAWAAHLRGDLDAATKTFQEAEKVEREIDSDVRYLYSMRGIRHADHLRRAGDSAYTQRITEANLKVCEENRFIMSISQCHRVLGDLDADGGQHNSAREHYDEALKIARSITRRDVLIEALLARGRWQARHMKDAPAAFSDLNEALDYAVDGGYRIYEADIRIALAWAHLADTDPKAARAEAKRAQQMSEQMGYHWGKVDAAEVLAEL